MIVSVDVILETKDDDEIGYLVDVDLDYAGTIKNKARYIPSCPESEKVDKNFSRLYESYYAT